MTKTHDDATTPAEPPNSSKRGLTRQILALAVPALGALIAEPLFLLADTAIIGWLGVNELAGAALGITILQTVVGLMIFLAYSTTPAVARFIGAGKTAKALASARDGIWLAVGLGLLLTLGGFAFGEDLLRAMGSSGAMHAHAWDYLAWSLPGMPAMLLVFAAVGALRGLQDTKTPLVVAAAGFGANAVLNLVLVHPLGMGTAGAGLGSTLAHWGMAVAYLVILVPRLRRSGVALTPDPAGLRSSMQVGWWMFLRTAMLRAAILATVLVATDLGPTALAAHQVAFVVFSTMAFALDALAIAAQALIGRELGAERKDGARGLMRVMILWSLGFGVITGALVAIAAPWAPILFTSDEQVAAGITVALFVLAASQPLAGFVFILDGVLMGAGDVRYLALAGVLNLAIYLPALWWVSAQGFTGTTAVMWLWIGFAGVFMGARGVTLGLRALSTRWMIIGEQR